MIDGLGNTIQLIRKTLEYRYFVSIGLVGIVSHGENDQEVHTIGDRVHCTSGISRMSNIGFYKEWIKRTMADTMATCFNT